MTKLSLNEYNNIHIWLRKNYGKAQKCEARSCGTYTNVQWALKKGKEYEKKRENFKQMCVSCHKNYDLSEIKKQITPRVLELAQEWSIGTLRLVDFCLRLNINKPAGYQLLARSLKEIHYEQTNKG